MTKEFTDFGMSGVDCLQKDAFYYVVVSTANAKFVHLLQKHSCANVIFKIFNNFDNEMKCVS